MVDDDKLFDEDEVEEPVLPTEEEEDELDMFDEDDEEDEDDLDPKHLDSLGFGIEEEEF